MSDKATSSKPAEAPRTSPARSKADRAQQRQGRRLPSYNPAAVLRDAVKAQGFDPGEMPLSIAESSYPQGSFPLEGVMQDHPAPSFEEALKPKGPGDPGVPKYSPRTTGKEK